MAGARVADRPFLFVLAGVNGAGKSSVGGSILEDQGLKWFNPDSFSRELVKRSGLSKEDADIAAWTDGKERLEAAIANGANFAFETTLGGNTIRDLIAKAAETHDVLMIFCGLASLQMHIDRVKMRVRHGGHDIPEERIRARWDNARRNLIELLPCLAQLQVFDNSKEVPSGAGIPYPDLVLEMKNGRALYPAHDDVQALRATPDWAKCIVAAALRSPAAQNPPPAKAGTGDAC